MDIETVRGVFLREWDSSQRGPRKKRGFGMSITEGKGYQSEGLE